MIYSYKGNFPRGESVIGKVANLTDNRRGDSGMQLVFSGALRASYIGRLMKNSEERKHGRVSVPVRAFAASRV